MSSNFCVLGIASVDLSRILISWGRLLQRIEKYINAKFRVIIFSANFIVILYYRLLIYMIYGMAVFLRNQHTCVKIKRNKKFEVVIPLPTSMYNQDQLVRIYIVFQQYLNHLQLMSKVKEISIAQLCYQYVEENNLYEGICLNTKNRCGILLKNGQWKRV